MKKIDEAALRAQLSQQFSQILDALRANPDTRNEAATLERALPAMIELTTFGIMEVRRTDDPLEGIAQLGHIVGNALMSVCNSFEDAEPPAKGEMDAAHKAIHTVVNAIDRTMHGIYADANKSDGDGETITSEFRELPMRDVGDA